MGAVVSVTLIALSGVLAIPVILFCIEILAALLLRQREQMLPPADSKRPSIAILIPAHNESSGVLATLNDIRQQLESGDRALLVADNCTDDTAAIAKLAGVEVTERNDPARIGKGYALEWGLRQLRGDPPQVVIVIDADCRLSIGTIERLATVSLIMNRPIQALYLMSAPDQSPVNYQVASFAFRVKNWVRPFGLRALNLPCQLMGTGMAFPWALINSVDLATGAAVEDLKLGLDLACAGHPPFFCPSAGISSQFPVSFKGAKSQRKRWEQGHLAMIIKRLPRLVYESFVQRNISLLILSLDMAVPPLTLLAMLLTMIFLVSGFGILCGLDSTALIVSSAILSIYLIATLLCWLKFGRDILPLSSITSVFSYFIGKLPVYGQIFSRGSGSQWIRTDRDKMEGGTKSFPDKHDAK